MCGLAGYVGIKNKAQRMLLASALGEGIDKRGGHAAGYVSIPSAESPAGIAVGRRIGTWRGAGFAWVEAAAAGEVAMMHARWATHGHKDDLENAHPFTIVRDGRDVLVGAHNGVLGQTESSAKRHGRKHTVDSRECFELLADGLHDKIRKLSGYGVLTWVTPDSGEVNLVCLSDNSPITSCVLSDGAGLVWGSTASIVEDALRIAHLGGKEYKEFRSGTVYRMTATGPVETAVTGITVGEKETKLYGGAYGSGRQSAWYDMTDERFAEWEKEFDLRYGCKPTQARARLTATNNHARHGTSVAPSLAIADKMPPIPQGSSAESHGAALSGRKVGDTWFSVANSHLWVKTEKGWKNIGTPPNDAAALVKVVDAVVKSNALPAPNVPGKSASDEWEELQARHDAEFDATHGEYGKYMPAMQTPVYLLAYKAAYREARKRINEGLAKSASRRVSVGPDTVRIRVAEAVKEAVAAVAATVKSGNDSACCNPDETEPEAPISEAPISEEMTEARWWAMSDHDRDVWCDKYYGTSYIRALEASGQSKESSDGKILAM